MAIWFFRNNIKSTEINKFELIKIYAKNNEASNICNELRTSRIQAVDFLKNKNSKFEDVETALNRYISLIYGAICPKIAQENHENLFPANSKPSSDSQAKTKSDGSFSDKIRKSATFVWDQATSARNQCVCADLAFDLASILFQAGLYFMIHARNRIIMTSEYDEENCTFSFRTLKKAASLFKKAREITDIYLTGTFNEDHNRKPNDLDQRILNGHYLQCMAEIMEIIGYRAANKKGSEKVMCDIYTRALGYYEEACRDLESFSSKTSQQLLKWITFLNLKMQYLYVLAHLALGGVMIKENQCGRALRCGQEAEKGIELINKLVKQFNGIHTEKNNVDAPKDFLPNVIKIVKNSCEKFKYENSLIYHQQIANEAPKLPQNPYYGQIEEEEYKIEQNPIWTKRAYSGFNVTDN